MDSTEPCFINNRKHGNVNWLPFLRQMFISSGVWTFAFMFGLSFGVPTVAIPQLRKEYNETSMIDIHLESWLSSAMLFGGIPWVFILTILVYAIGRKKTFLIISITSLIGFIIVYFGASITYIFIYQVIQGPLAVSQMTTSFLVEYISPKYRGVFCTVQVGTMFWGIWVSNAIGTFSHWSNIILVGIICALYNVINVFLWPESPYWLSIKGRFTKCIESHRWLKGIDERSEKELADLLKINKDTTKLNATFIREHTREFFKVILLPEVYKPSALCLLTISMYHLSGKVVYTIYSLTVIKKITGNESTAYIGMLILDGITVASLYSGSFLTLILTRRMLLLSTSLLTSLFLLSLSLYAYLIKSSLIFENVFVTITLLTLFSSVVSVGPLCINGILIGELMPLKSRSVFVFIFTLYGKCLVAIMIKVSPYLFKYLDLHGSFLFYGIAMFVCLCLTYKYLPETKDKTLIEISENFKRTEGSFEEVKELMLIHTCDSNKLKSASSKNCT
ncbi:facilitated trehalose transporter Tret1 isoform X1 [Amyelois transitella]|uniref:facilitated trehalose transporter Tret1 isoform X1 n=2 Tax=Amyelois transitella TaxID=680683 RepID=UPI0029907C75|nr:facilitated trehalose transporter Tret1 isoform X1 [Amyelois transitella]